MRMLPSAVIFLCVVCLAAACSAGRKTSPTVVDHQPVKKDTQTMVVKTPEDPFFAALFSQDPMMKNLLAAKKERNIQIVYTQIDRSKNGEPTLKQHFYNTKDQDYFYPASTVKLPVVLLALQKLQELKDKGIDMNTPMLNLASYSGQTDVYNDPNTADGIPTIAGYIKKILLVSDNDAYNRLYEFLGQNYINSQLRLKGYEDVRILHRLDIFLTEDENRHTNEIAFYDREQNLLYRQPQQFNEVIYPLRNDLLGQGYYSNGKLVMKPMDFSKKNRLPLPVFHSILQSLVFPGSVPASKRFNITEDDRQFVLKYMSAYPRESDYPYYDSSYYDAYAKFIFYGADKAPVNSSIRIFNKVGDAYGQLTDAAYVVDFDNKIEFLVSATIYCNPDGILNDDKYDYNETGLPFLKNLGQAIYQFEKKRKKPVLPDLSPLKFPRERN